MDIIKLSAYEINQKLISKELTSVEVTSAFIEQIKKTEPDINAFITTTFDEALEVAKKVDQLRSNGEMLPVFAGVPIAIKDVVVTKGVQTTAGSKMLEGWIPPYDATLITRIKQNMMPILGKTNMDEFAMGSSTEYSAYGKTCNPRNLECIPGGSGGGSAAAVAAYQAPLAIGTDTGGSIRQPAAVTGTVGAKPTYGFVSRYGLVAMASSLDQAGPCANSVLDCAVLQDIIQGYDYHDSTSLKESDLNKDSSNSTSSNSTSSNSNCAAAQKGLELASQKDGLKGLRVGLVKELEGDGFAPLVKERFNDAVQKLKDAGADVQTISCPHFEYALGAYYLIMPSEASSNLAKFDGMRYGQRVDGETATEMMKNTRGEKFGKEVKRRILLGTYALSSGYYDAYYGSAQKVRTLIKQDFEDAFKKVDVLLSPSSPTVAFKFGEKLDDPLAMYMNDIATIPANLAGTPAISLPSGLAENDLPAGIQIMAPAFQDAKMYQIAASLEKLIKS